MRRCFVSLFIILIVLIPLVTRAQITTDISLEVIPITPDPGQTTTIRATSYGADLSQASITWTYNNTVITRGIGRTEVRVVAPAAGATGVVVITASGSGFGNASASVVLRPASIDVLWEAADATVPPFYKGKALLAPNGLIRFTAIPSPSAPKGVSYTWSRNGQALQNNSGYNRSNITFAHSEFNKEEQAEVEAVGGVFTGTGVARVAPRNPSMVTYQNKEGFIDYANGYRETIPFTQSGMVLHFEPYYFSVNRSIASDLSFDLKVDGTSVETSRGTEVGLSRPTRSGQSTVDLTITPVAYSLQHLTTSLKLLF